MRWWRIARQCSTGKGVISTFIKLELYIALIALSILLVLYTVSLIPMATDVLRIAILVILILTALYLWYKVTLRIVRSRL